MAWKPFRQPALFLVKWAIATAAGTIGFLEFAPRYEQFKAYVGSLMSGLPPPSTENLFWDIVSIALMVVGVAIIVSDIRSRVKSRSISRHETQALSNEPEFEDKIWEFDVGWHLSGDIQAKPYFGSQDMLGSGKASKLRVKQEGKKQLTLTGKMAKLKPSWQYDVYLSKPTRPFSIFPGVPFHPIGPEEAPYLTFKTDESGNYTWSIPIGIGDLERYGIVDRFMIWVNDSPKNKSVLASDFIPIKLFEDEESTEHKYELATLQFRIQSTTDWIEVGLLDSKSVTIRNRSLVKGVMRPHDEPDAPSFLRIDHPDAEFSVTAMFEVHSAGPLRIFTRKGDMGTLKVDILDKNGTLLLEIPEYGMTEQKFNHKQFKVDFNDWD